MAGLETLDYIMIALGAVSLVIWLLVFVMGL